MPWRKFGPNSHRNNAIAGQSKPLLSSAPFWKQGRELCGRHRPQVSNIAKGNDIRVVNASQDLLHTELSELMVNGKRTAVGVIRRVIFRLTVKAVSGVKAGQLHLAFGPA